MYRRTIKVVLPLTPLTTPTIIQLAFLIHFVDHFRNRTKRWTVYIVKETVHRNYCIATASNPSILLKLSEVRFRDEHVMLLLVDFLTHDKYALAMILISY